MSTRAAPSERTRIRRIAERARYDRQTVQAIVDAAYCCSIAFADHEGVHCIPTICWREDDHLYVHGSNGSRMLKALAGGTQACVTITLLDGLVLARSAFHHSMNFRSVVVYGRFEPVAQAGKAASLGRLMERLAPGRSREARPPDANELAATTVLRIPLAEAAAKIRTGGPVDDEADMQRPVWAGVLPLALQGQAPQADGEGGLPLPPYVEHWEQGHRS
jgi:nitroimidazol reductase NimA-like FMN-containing flavoprotein (pyridoxamine 5'-phosphate oxidase superfamily)